MINSLGIENFKCFAHLRLDLCPLTLFTGYNGAGKSSFIQPIALLSQALKYQEKFRLPLNGPLTKLGTTADVVSGKDLSFEIVCGKQSLKWNFLARAGERFLSVDSVKNTYRTEEKYFSSKWANGLWPDPKKDFDASVTNCLSSLIMISTSRLGTLDVQPMPDEASAVRGDVGIEGQYASYWYDCLVDDEVEIKLRLKEEPGTTTRMQVDAYLSRLFSGAKVNVTAIPQAGVYALRYRLGDGELRRPANIGYGFTYAFPIIVALLTARPGQTIFIDSPEAHLHPSAQSKMGNLLAKVASTGVQILVETHSDHLLNGVRLAVKKTNILPDDVAIHFFSGSSALGHGVTSPKIDFDGNISDWPSGFFDQGEADLARLAGWI